MDVQLAAEIERVITVALAEDVGAGDVTTGAVVESGQQATGEIQAREPMVVSGLDVAKAVFLRVSGDLRVQVLKSEGEAIQKGMAVMRVTGSAGAILTAERSALNLLQHLCGVATLTRRFVEAIRGTGAVILDTRKTTPGMRWLEKRAVRHGGGQNHRFGLFDAILIKDNHLAALEAVSANPVAEAVRRSRERYPGWPVEVEADNLEQVRLAVECGVEAVLLDNMALGELREAVEILRGKARSEASGGVRLETVRSIAETGVDSISVGALTHGAAAVDLGLDWKVERVAGL